MSFGPTSLLWLVIIGALVLGMLGELMRIWIPTVSEATGIPIPAQVRYVLFGLILILVMRYKPDGLYPVAAEEEARGKERLGDHRGAVATLFSLKGDVAVAGGADASAS